MAGPRLPSLVSTVSRDPGKVSMSGRKWGLTLGEPNGSQEAPEPPTWNWRQRPQSSSEAQVVASRSLWAGFWGVLAARSCLPGGPCPQILSPAGELHMNLETPVLSCLEQMFSVLPTSAHSRPDNARVH